MSDHLTYRNQVNLYLPQLCQILLDLKWDWILLAYRHVLTAALDFLCLKDL